MPTYEYACTACGEHLEVVQRFTDSSLTECPSCEGRLRKVFSPVGVVFKGSGFYKTDSRKQSGSSSGSSSGGSSTSPTTGEKKDGAKAESAPAATSESSTTSTTPPSSGSSPTAAAS